MADAPTSYDSPGLDGRQPSIAKVERTQLCDLFDEVGPGRATLCEGWTTHHLAAHLVIREGFGLATARNLVPGQGDKAVESTVAAVEFAELVRRLRTGPPTISLFSLPRVDDTLNTLELLIHHEDVRRGEGTWEPRTLPGWVDDTVWSQTVKTAKLTMFRSKRALTLRRADTGEETQVSKGSGSRIVSGPPVELALYLSGRKTAALVDRAD